MPTSVGKLAVKGEKSKDAQESSGLGTALDTDSRLGGRSTEREGGVIGHPSASSHTKDVAEGLFRQARSWRVGKEKKKQKWS